MIRSWSNIFCWSKWVIWYIFFKWPKNEIESFFCDYKIFDHFPDHAHKHTILIKVPKKLEFPGPSVDEKNSIYHFFRMYWTLHHMYIHIHMCNRELEINGYFLLIWLILFWGEIEKLFDHIFELRSWSWMNKKIVIV